MNKQYLSENAESVKRTAQRTVELLRTGWIQNDMDDVSYFDGEKPVAEPVRCYCLLGALRQASQGGYRWEGDTPLFQELSADLFRHLKRVDPTFRQEIEEDFGRADYMYGVTIWNDKSGRTKAEVVERAEKWAKRFK